MRHTKKNSIKSKKTTLKNFMKKPKCSKSGLMGDQEDIFTLDTCSKYKGGATTPTAATVLSSLKSLIQAKDGRRKRRQTKRKSGRRR